MQAFWLAFTENVESYKWFENYVTNLEAVTLEEVKQAAAHYLRPQNRTIGISFRWMDGAPEKTWRIRMSGVSLPGSHNITRVTLANGITILVYEKFDAQSVVISGSLRAGAIYETPAQNGLASLTAVGAAARRQKRGFNAINAALEDIGADLSLSANTNTTSFSGKVAGGRPAHARRRARGRHAPAGLPGRTGRAAARRNPDQLAVSLARHALPRQPRLPRVALPRRASLSLQHARHGRDRLQTGARAIWRSSTLEFTARRA